MKTTNNFETVQTHATVTTKKTAVDKFEAFLNKCDCFVQKAKPVVSRFFEEKVPHACDKLEKFLMLFVGECVNLTRGYINLAVKLSIVLIALLMLQNYIKANPAEWAHIVSIGQGLLESVRSTANAAVESLKNTYLGFFSIFNFFK